MLFYALTISLSAFLLFEVQPVIAKMILPWFGGSSAVWSTCMLFFQMVLLLGYAYAHWLNKLAPRRQAIAHISLLAVSLAALPIIPESRLEARRHRAALAHHPRAARRHRRTALLPALRHQPAAAGLVRAHAQNRPALPPVRALQLLLHAGAAQLSLPDRTQPASRTQGLVWSAAFRRLRAPLRPHRLAHLRGHRRSLSDDAAAGRNPHVAPPTWAARLLWLGLAACASILLLAVTTHLTQDVAAIPFLWILPLAVYLLSFILCFESPRLYHRAVFVPLFDRLAWLHGVPPLAGSRQDGPAPRASPCFSSRSSSAAWSATANWRASSPTRATSPASM